ncbi:undecaprenyl-diphosphatase [Bacillus salipaludis]|uniref:undecaprenyl-diphosphatase n=1 Tax=Bacillus salipaludis TaxID=2547811 RepID=UPI002E1DDA07|nr:undecaprenyl-diphosphatase [Bacillus salipaludis]
MSQLNIEAFRAINNLGKDHLFLDPIAVFLAEYMLYFLILGMLVYWFTRTDKNRMMIILSVISVAVAEVIGKIAGKFYSHYQPFAELPHVNKLVSHAVDNAFPSDHSIIFFSICFSILLVRKKEGWLWIILACCVAISRVMVGVHYPLDVLTGALIGIISALLVYLIAPKLSFLNKLLAIYEKAEGVILPKSKSGDRNKNF